jgi:hypothetical protein
MMMPGRKYQAGAGFNYRFSINGQEKESELNENITTAEYWEYDSRIGRRWNVDPKSNSSISPYDCFAGNPIRFADPLGDTTINGQKMEGQNSASASTLPEILITKQKQKPIGVDPKSVVQINTNVKCHTPTTVDVNNAWQKQYNEQTANLDRVNGQLFPPISRFTDYFLLGGRSYGIHPVTSEGYVQFDKMIPQTGTPPALIIKGIPTNVFFTVQSEEDAARLVSGGGIWPTGPSRSHLGTGVYAWGSNAEASAYLTKLTSRGITANLKIVQLEINSAKLSQLRSFIVPTEDAAANEWLGKYSSLFGSGKPHGYQYIQRSAGMGTEHYFSVDIFNQFKVK